MRFATSLSQYYLAILFLLFCSMTMANTLANAQTTNTHATIIDTPNDTPSDTPNDIPTDAILTPLSLSAGEWPPYLSADLPHQGIVAQLIKDIFAKAGYQVSFTFLPWTRAYKSTANSEYAATAVWMHQPDREHDFWYSEPVLNEQFVFFHLKHDGFDWHTMQDLSGKIVGGVRAYSYGPVLDQALEEGIFSMTRVNSTEQSLRMLAAGRTDLFAEEMNIGYHILRNRMPDIADLITHHPTPFSINQSYLLFPKQSEHSEALRAVFNQHLAAFKEDGRYQAYFEGLED